jgi:hypothetical protein
MKWSYERGKNEKTRDGGENKTKLSSLDCIIRLKYIKQKWYMTSYAFIKRKC